MWKDQKVTVVFPTYNEKDSIRKAIEDFLYVRYIDEIVVVNNNAVSGTDEEVMKTEAVLVHEKKQGYGYSIRKGLQTALDRGADILIISEPDGTFVGKDCIKLLVYSDDFPVVFGTRTNKSLIFEGANMGLLLKFGNFFTAKLVEFIFYTNELSDVGCTFRAIHRKELEKIMPQFTVGGSHFGLEFILRVIMNKISFIEIPLSYLPRVGKSSVTGYFHKTVILGIMMVLFILKTRILNIIDAILHKISR